MENIEVNPPVQGTQNWHIPLNDIINLFAGSINAIVDNMPDVSFVEHLESGLSVGKRHKDTSIQVSNEVSEITGESNLKGNLLHILDALGEGEAETSFTTHLTPPLTVVQISEGYRHGSTNIHTFDISGWDRGDSVGESLAYFDTQIDNINSFLENVLVDEEGLPKVENSNITATMLPNGSFRVTCEESGTGIERSVLFTLYLQKQIGSVAATSTKQVEIHDLTSGTYEALFDIEDYTEYTVKCSYKRFGSIGDSGSISGSLDTQILDTINPIDVDVIPMPGYVTFKCNESVSGRENAVNFNLSFQKLESGSGHVTISNQSITINKITGGAYVCTASIPLSATRVSYGIVRMNGVLRSDTYSDTETGLQSALLENVDLSDNFVTKIAQDVVGRLELRTESETVFVKTSSEDTAESTKKLVNNIRLVVR